MLFFQIDNYNNPCHLVFKTKDEAKKYIEEHPETVGSYVQVTEDTKNQDVINGTFPNNGTYEVRMLRTHSKVAKPTLVYSQDFAGAGKSFQDIFGTCKSSRGTIQNKILLAFWKARLKRDTELGKKSGKDKYPNGFASQKIQNLNELFNVIIEQLNNNRPVDDNGNQLPSSQYGFVTFRLNKTTYQFASKKYADAQSSSRGLSYCTDYRCVKVLDRETTKEKASTKYVTVKASKIILDSIKTNRAIISEQATTYVAEEFQRRYESEMAKLLNGLELHIDDHFDYIYSDSYCAHDFGSCMCGKRQYTFYKEIMPASAAYLVDTNLPAPKNIVARCILFHNVKREEFPDKTFNYAERQYSRDELYKHILISKLIEAGAIDLYKTIGAGCREVTNVIDTNGRRIGDTRLSIKAKRKLQRGDTLSFQDTFIHYCPETGTFSNYAPKCTYREMGHVNARYEYDD